MHEQSCLVPVGPQVRHYAERMDATLSPEQDSFGIIRLLWFCRVFGCSRDSACSHRLRGLPSSAGSPSLLHLRALAPQRRVVSFRQGTVEPQPPPHASSVVAWPIARQGFYSGQPTPYPGSDLSRGRSHSPSCQRNRTYDERPNRSSSSTILVGNARKYY